jgi:hypothetical protein
MINFLPRNDKIVTFYNKCPKFPASISMHFENNVQSSRVVRLSCTPSSFMQAAGPKMQTNNFSRASTILLLTSLFVQPQNRNLKELGREIQTDLT